MPFFLFKIETGVCSFDDFLRDRKTIWANVNNARAFMRTGTV